MSEQPELISEERGEYKLTSEEQAEKESYRQLLREKLRDPQFRQIEGFPIGDDEAILALSDPPHYTACPNPFLDEIIAKWQQEREETNRKSQIENHKYHREPFATDVSEGKNDPIYNAHSYHTKVPHKAIMRYILHYTQPGDIVLDGFCGTGMTGVAAQLCGDRKTVESLGYHVDENAQVLDEKGETVSQLGARKAVLVDLSTAATFIAHNFNTPVDVRRFEQEAKRILKVVDKECGWMYETTHTDGKTKGRINFTVWSDVFICPSCNEEVVFWDAAIDHKLGKMRDEWECHNCHALISKRARKKTGALRAERAFELVFDQALNKTVRQAKQIPAIINYSVGKKRFEKRPDENDLLTIQKITNSTVNSFFPMNLVPDGFNLQQPRESHGVTHVHHFYTHRNLLVLSTLWKEINRTHRNDRLKFWFTATLTWCGRENRLHISNYFGKSGGVITSLRGTWYISSLSVETNVLERFRFRIKSSQYQGNFSPDNAVVFPQSSANLLSLEESVDYIFVDPPFGSNLMYSELNLVWESWLGVLTNNQSEAIVNKVQKKGLAQYQFLMESCFREFYRVLKAGHWMTVEFHNSQNAVWNIIQEALLRAGFMVADIRILDKGKGSFQQVTNTSATKQDLIISAYKPNDNLEERFRLQAGSVDGAWDFVRYHLGQLPVVVEKSGELETVAERQDFLLFDRMVAFHIQRGASVPLSAGEFYSGLRQRFVERDGMFFLPEQVPDYDSARLRLGRAAQLALFVKDEKSAIQWLRQQLEPSLGGEPTTFQDLQPVFLQGLHQAKHESLPELHNLLEQNFLQDEQGRWYVPDPSKASDLEKVRLKSLLREFGTYVEGRGRLRQFRSEAVRAGFGECWQKREYATIIMVAERLPESVLHEDPDLLMYYDNASLRLSDE